MLTNRSDAGRPPEAGGTRDEEVELERYAKEGRDPGPHQPGRRYRIRIDKQHKVVDVREMTGAQILGLVDKTPSTHRLDRKMRGGAVKKIEATDIVDFTEPGIEKFMTLPLDQTEGAGTAPSGEREGARAVDVLRREFDLPEEDEDELSAVGMEWETVNALEQGGSRNPWVFVQDFAVPDGYTDPYGRAIESLVAGVRLTGYPGGALDMVYFDPPLRRADGRAIKAVSVLQVDGRTFQQWSRHYTGTNPFRVGVDTLASHLRAVSEWLWRELR
ncbi:MAG: multiubiquitin domain-containing protein [Longimicrobiaceae bacterium]